MNTTSTRKTSHGHIGIPKMVACRDEGEGGSGREREKGGGREGGREGGKEGGRGRQIRVTVARGGIERRLYIHVYIG